MGESRTFELAVPEDFGMAALRGQQVQVDVTLHELFCWDMPELNDAWANKYVLVLNCCLSLLEDEETADCVHCIVDTRVSCHT